MFCRRQPILGNFFPIAARLNFLREKKFRKKISSEIFSSTKFSEAKYWKKFRARGRRLSPLATPLSSTELFCSARHPGGQLAARNFSSCSKIFCLGSLSETEPRAHLRGGRKSEIFCRDRFFVVTQKYQKYCPENGPKPKKVPEKGHFFRWSFLGFRGAMNFCPFFLSNKKNSPADRFLFAIREPPVLFYFLFGGRHLLGAGIKIFQKAESENQDTGSGVRTWWSGEIATFLSAWFLFPSFVFLIFVLLG